MQKEDLNRDLCTPDPGTISPLCCAQILQIRGNKRGGWVLTTSISTPPNTVLSSLHSRPGERGCPPPPFSCGAPHSQRQGSLSPPPMLCSRGRECAAPFAELSEPRAPGPGSG